MRELVAQFPNQIIEAVEIALNSNLSINKNESFDHVIICGMGGSGIGGKVVTQLFEKESKIPLVLVQDYSLPAFVNEKSLVIASSYSGTTEETLVALDEAVKRNSTIVGVSSGGKLIEICQNKGYDYIQLPSGKSPRGMLAYSMIQLMHILETAGIISTGILEIVKNGKVVLDDNIDEIKEKGQQLAQLFFQKQGVIYADADSESVAIRARQQINENSKQLVWHHVIPEMNHNELVGWGGGNDHYAVVFFVSQFLAERNRLRTELSQEIIGKKTPHTIAFQGKGKNRLEEFFYFNHIIDWASVYLADLNKQDAVEVRVIDYLKGELNKA